MIQPNSASEATAAPQPRTPGDQALLQELEALQQNLLDVEAEQGERLQQVAPGYRSGARNLLHFIAFHRRNHPGLAQRLRERGLWALDGSDAALLSTLQRVIERLAGGRAAAAAQPPQRCSLDERCSLLFGPGAMAADRTVMVTLPAAASRQPQRLEELIDAGMAVARINCGHDDAAGWAALATAVRDAARRRGQRCLVAMDLAGPKLRTCGLAPLPGVIDVRPERDRYGRLLQAASLLAWPADAPAPSGEELPAGVQLLPVLELPAVTAGNGPSPGEQYSGRDASGRMRELHVRGWHGRGLLLSARQHCRFTAGLTLRHGGGGPGLQVAPLPEAAGELRLRIGEQLRLGATIPVTPNAASSATPTAAATPATTAAIGCSLPELLQHLQPGERVLFDDGRIAAVIRAVDDEGALLEITQAKARGSRLRNDQGIHLPDSHLRLPALTAQDRQDLAVAAQHADIVNVSFVNSPQDVRDLIAALEPLQRPDLGVVLKIETLEAVQHLPELLLQAMTDPRPLGLMIARGDLAVACGWEAMAPIQEELLRLAAAAHLPCIWATQVLDQMAHHGTPTRAEISDAALALRADAVMLNQGPNIAAAVRTLRAIAAGMLPTQPGHPRHDDALLCCMAFNSNCAFAEP